MERIESIPAHRSPTGASGFVRFFSEHRSIAIGGEAAAPRSLISSAFRNTSNAQWRLVESLSCRTRWPCFPSVVALRTSAQPGLQVVEMRKCDPHPCPVGEQSPSFVLREGDFPDALHRDDGTRSKLRQIGRPSASDKSPSGRKTQNVYWRCPGSRGAASLPRANASPQLSRVPPIFLWARMRQPAKHQRRPSAPRLWMECLSND